MPLRGGGGRYFRFGHYQWGWGGPGTKFWAKSKSIMVFLDHVFLSLKKYFLQFLSVIAGYCQLKLTESISSSSCRQYRHTLTWNKESGGIRKIWRLLHTFYLIASFFKAGDAAKCSIWGLAKLFWLIEDGDELWDTKDCHHRPTGELRQDKYSSNASWWLTSRCCSA